MTDSLNLTGLALLFNLYRNAGAGRKRHNDFCVNSGQTVIPSLISGGQPSTGEPTNRHEAWCLRFSLRLTANSYVDKNDGVLAKMVNCERGEEGNHWLSSKTPHKSQP